MLLGRARARAVREVRTPVYSLSPSRRKSSRRYAFQVGRTLTMGNCSGALGRVLSLSYSHELVLTSRRCSEPHSCEPSHADGPMVAGVDR
jgi:hypothetical protein